MHGNTAPSCTLCLSTYGINGSWAALDYAGNQGVRIGSQKKHLALSTNSPSPIRVKPVTLVFAVVCMIPASAAVRISIDFSDKLILRYLVSD